jgi:hypothetical protein
MGPAACMGETRNSYKILVGQPEWTRPCRRPRCKMDNIRMNLRKKRVGRCGLDASGSG